MWGFDRGLPIDRYYVEHFLRRLAYQPDYGVGAIRGRVLEVGGSEYATKFGCPIEAEGSPANRITQLDVLHRDRSNPEATVVGDLTRVEDFEAGGYDCVICTQTLQVVFDVSAAVASIYRMLAPGGEALVTLPGITRNSVPDRDHWGDFWRFTSASARRLFEEAFPADALSVEAYGNILAATAFLQGIASGELRQAELDLRDPEFDVLIAVRARKAP